MKGAEVDQVDYLRNFVAGHPCDLMAVIAETRFAWFLAFFRLDLYSILADI